MDRVRWLAFALVQLIAFGTAAVAVIGGREHYQPWPIPECGGRQSTFSDFVYGYPLPWSFRRVIHFDRQRNPENDSPPHTTRNLVLPLAVSGFLLMLPWVAFTLFKRSPSRMTKLMRVGALASLSTVFFAVGDIVTGRSILKSECRNRTVLKPLFADRLVVSVVDKIEDLRRKYERRSMEDTMESDRDGAIASREFALRSAGCWIVVALVGSLVIRPWRRPIS
jgi:hypothetical protein